MNETLLQKTFYNNNILFALNLVSLFFKVILISYWLAIDVILSLYII